jgi:hypothetical protein
MGASNRRSVFEDIIRELIFDLIGQRKMQNYTP